jgi:ubiquinol-cytochrome c reductase cytochrome c1 subunit
MKKLILAICLLFSIHLSLGASDIQLLKAPVNLEDKQSLQRGARNFINYCLNCHSASYMRYNQLQLIGLSEETIKKDLLFTSDKIGNPMSISMGP